MKTSEPFVREFSVTLHSDIFFLLFIVKSPGSVRTFRLSEGGYTVELGNNRYSFRIVFGETCKVQKAVP